MNRFESVIRLVSWRVGGRHTKEVERFIKFALVGALGFLIGFGTVIILQNTILPPNDHVSVALVTSISFILALGGKFIGNYFWVYPDSRSYSRLRQLTQFAIVSVISLAFRNLWVTVTYEGFGQQAVSFMQNFNEDFQPTLIDRNKLGTNVALIIGVMIGMFWNFLANRYWTFRDVD